MDTTPPRINIRSIQRYSRNLVLQLKFLTQRKIPNCSERIVAGGYGTHNGRQATFFSMLNPWTDPRRPDPNSKSSRRFVRIGYGDGTADGFAVLPNSHLVRLMLLQHSAGVFHRVTTPGGQLLVEQHDVDPVALGHMLKRSRRRPLSVVSSRSRNGSYEDYVGPNTQQDDGTNSCTHEETCAATDWKLGFPLMPPSNSTGSNIEELKNTDLDANVQCVHVWRISINFMEAYFAIAEI